MCRMLAGPPDCGNQEMSRKKSLTMGCAKKTGVRRLAGSFLTHQEPTKLAQEPPLRIAQLEPTIAEIKVAEDVLQPRKVVRDGKVKPTPKPYVKPVTTRQRYRLSRKDVAALLDKPGVTEALPPTMCSQYRALAARNISLDELAAKHHVSEIAMEAIIEIWESDIVSKACELYQKFNPRSSEPQNDRDGEKAENEAETAQDAEIAKTEGGSIGGRIVSGGKNAAGRPKRLYDFERSGRLRESDRDPDRDKSGSHVSEEDDYGEESGA
jgi:hypothetical protein